MYKRQAYTTDLCDYASFLDGRGVGDADDVDRACVVAYEADLVDRGYATSSVDRRVSVIKGFHRFLVREGYARRNPTDTLQLPKPPERLPDVLSASQVGAMLAACTGDGPPEMRNRAILEVLYGCGLRVSECTGLEDVYKRQEPSASGFPCGSDARTFFALNELAVTRGAHGRIIDFGLSISGARIAGMRGDGLVVATATGSTAYALSAGGPLVSPGFAGLVAVPLAPHTLHSRAIVTASNDVVEMDLSHNADTREATLFVDGELLEFCLLYTSRCV